MNDAQIAGQKYLRKLLKDIKRTIKDPLAMEGYEAYDEGSCDESDNPYPEGTDGEMAWIHGWRTLQKMESLIREIDRQEKDEWKNQDGEIKC